MKRSVVVAGGSLEALEALAGDGDGNVPSDGAGQLTRPTGRYVIGLALVALLAVASGLLTASGLARLEQDAAILDTAARQVVLAERVGEAAQRGAGTEAVAAWEQFLAGHARLREGDSANGIPPAEDDDVLGAYASLDPLVAKIDGLIGEGSWPEVDWGRVAAEADLAASAMESVVAEYRSAAEGRAARLQQSQYLLMSATLILLVFEGLFLFRPAARQAREQWESQLAQHLTERESDQRKLAYLARYDSLTGLVNRTLFMDRLEGAVRRARRDGGLVSLMFLDIDHFKTVNDRYGHAVGDALLRQVAERLTSSVRESDTVSRLGGDEFTVILEGAHRVEDAGKVATKILTELALPYRVSHRELHVTASIGIAIYPLDGEDAEGLLRDADIAMYSAKGAGRNTYQFFTAELREQTTERLNLLDGLRRALEGGDQLHLVYQPKLDTATGAIVGTEALVRWTHPALGTVLPGKFIPLAEETDLIIPLGEWVLRQAVQQAKAWEREGVAALPVSVNVSSRQLRQGNLVEVVAAALEESALAPEHLEIELTERTLLDDTELSRRTLERLRDMGVAISIDDFGTGYSSLAYLKRFPIDTLKIDRSFVADVIDDHDDAAISAAIVGLARSLRLDVIAEGVETQEQQEFLSSLGCTKIQGYLVSRPLAVEAVAAFVAEVTSVGPPVAAVGEDPGASAA